jgi:hypothetical protein
MWEKWVGLATTVAGITCLMRASTGDSLAAHGGQETMVGLFRECSSVAEANGYVPRLPYIDLAMGMLNTVGSPFKALMLRDIERGSITEASMFLETWWHVPAPPAYRHPSLNLPASMLRPMKSIALARVATSVRPMMV